MNAARAKTMGIIDIGSNSVRLVGYYIASDVPTIICNEKEICSLGEKIEDTGKLSAASKKRTLKALERFRDVIETMQIKNVKAFATAAIRDAKNGQDFIEKIKNDTGITVKIISGQEEAAYSALGVLSGFPKAEGLVADLGGGSLELCKIDGEDLSHPNSLPMGCLRLLAKGKLARTLLEESLMEFHQDYKRAKALYAVGGTWRVIAEAHQKWTGEYRLHSHGYSMTNREFFKFAAHMRRVQEPSLIKNYAVPEKRARLVKVACMAAEAILKNYKIKKLIFSNAGLRDGFVYSNIHDVKIKDFISKKG